jgi:hypothetical protein
MGLDLVAGSFQQCLLLLLPKNPKRTDLVHHQHPSKWTVERRMRG